jgi:uncharacterized protein YggE
MFRRIFVIAFAASAFTAFGQLDSNSVTVSASHVANLQADQIVFDVYIDSGITINLDDVIAALAGSGITAANLSSLNVIQQNATNPAQPTVEWAFALPVPISGAKDAAAKLANIQQNIAKKNNGLTMSIQSGPTQVSQQLAQSQTCVVQDLIADARTQAQKLAEAADLTLGPILAMSGVVSTVSGAGNSVIPSPVAAQIFGAQPCYMTVKFTLLRLR